MGFCPGVWALDMERRNSASDVSSWAIVVGHRRLFSVEHWLGIQLARAEMHLCGWCDSGSRLCLMWPNTSKKRATLANASISRPVWSWCFLQFARLPMLWRCGSSRAMCRCNMAATFRVEDGTSRDPPWMLRLLGMLSLRVFTADMREVVIMVCLVTGGLMSSNNGSCLFLVSCELVWRYWIVRL